MEIFDKIGEVASQTYKYTTEKADKIAKETKLKMKMNENKSKIETLYNEIGEAVYRRHIATTKENFDEEIKNACEEIDKISKELEQQNNELLNLKDRKKHLPNELSGGQQQRVSIGRAIINSPAIMLADEPTGNLDSKASEEIISYLRLSNQKYNQTVIVITHDEKIAMEADRVIVIDDGKIVSDERKV